MNTIFLKETLVYNGSQLAGAFFRSYTKEAGDVAIAFIGPADVPTENLIDEVDRRAGESIKSERMVHFLIRLAGRTLETGVFAQRLYISVMLETLRYFGVTLDGTPILSGGSSIIREGDDIYRVSKSDRRKLSVSIATANRDSAFIHIGINVTGKNAPVPAVGLKDLGVNEKSFAGEALRRISAETDEIMRAKNKVRMVG